MNTLPTIGWREWVSLPLLGAEWTKAKVDTGARSSSLHAFDLERFERDGHPWVRFVVHPWQRSANDASVGEAPLLETRGVRSSSGRSQDRPVIRTVVRLGSNEHEIDLTLTRRDEMGFRMLLGREAIRGAYLVDPGRSYLTGRPPKEVRRANRTDGPNTHSDQATVLTKPARSQMSPRSDEPEPDETGAR